MKIGFIGTHGTGKTVATLQLVCELKKRGFNAEVVTEAARACPLPINENTTEKSQSWIFGEMLKREQESKADIIVCDRTLLDVIAYTERISPRYAEMMERFVDKYCATYDIIFYMEPNPKYLKKDGVRSVDLKFQQDIKDIIDRKITTLGVPVIKANEEQRLSMVLRILEFEKEGGEENDSKF
jgi:predicted ATPase